MPNKSHEDILKRIRALLAKTVERGASEQEAMMAAAKAAELMAKYDISLSEASAEERDDSVKTENRDCDFVLQEPLLLVAGAIAHFCSVREWREMRGMKASYHFMGIGPDAEIAAYLFDICARAMTKEAEATQKEWALLRKPVRYTKVRARLKGMSERLCFRIMELSWMRHKATGSALVPVKFDVIDQAMADEGIRLHSVSAKGSFFNGDEYKKGLAAGEGVELNQGLSSGKTGPLIL